MSAECAHTLNSGQKCHAPARNGGTFCHHHASRPRLDPHPRETRESEPITLPPLESKCAILVAINEIVEALAERRIKCSEARALLFGLKFAHRIMTELEEERRFSNSKNHPGSAEQSTPAQSAKPAPIQTQKPSPGELDQFVQSLQKAAVQHLRDQTAAPPRKAATATPDEDRFIAALAASSDDPRERRPSRL
jgi:hypothetical protein